MSKLTVVMYHYVRDLIHSRYPAIKGLDISLFKEQVGYLKKHYNFVTIEEVIETYYNGRELPPKAVLLTFDDAYIDHFTYVFPFLKKEGIQGAFYAPVKAIEEYEVLDVNKLHFILASVNEIVHLLDEIRIQLDLFREEYDLDTFENYFSRLAVSNRFDSAETIFVKRLLQVDLTIEVRKKIVNNLFQKFVKMDEKSFSRELYMSKDQLSCMVDNGMHVGSHCYDHFWLSSLSAEKQREEILKSKRFLEEIGCDMNNWTICYPYGDYNQDTIDILGVSDCKLGFTTKVDIADIGGVNGQYTIPRLDTNDLPRDISADIEEWYLKA